MSVKRSREWYKRLYGEWDRYVGDRATVREYAEGGAPYLARLRGDLEAWWGNHPDLARRLTPEEIEALAQRLEELIKAYLSPISSPGLVGQYRSHWPTSEPIPGGPLEQMGMGGRSAMSRGEEDDEDQELEP
jgi:hypothetical protein